MPKMYTELVHYDTVMQTCWVQRWVDQAVAGAIVEWERMRDNENRNMWITAGKAAEYAGAYTQVIEALLGNTELRDQRGIIAEHMRLADVEAHRARLAYEWHSVEVAERQSSIYEMFLRSWPRPRTQDEEIAHALAQRV